MKLQKLKKIVTTTLLTSSICLSVHSFAGQLTTFGAFLTQYIDQEMILESSRASIAPEIAAPMIEKYILKINPDRDTQYPNDLSTKELAKRIAGVSYCFKVDPFVYASLIHMESINYNQRARSPTGAVGLTQFTTIAVQEVSDQLGIRGNKYAQTEAITYFSDIIIDDCLAKQGGFKSMGKDYVPLWELDPANTLTKGSKSQATKMANMMDEYPEYALVYGAILLKVNYSLVVGGFKSGCYTYTNGHPVTMKDKIKELIMMYNGDGCTIQKKYQSDILGKFYSGITGTASK